MNAGSEWNGDRFISETARLIGREPDLSTSASRWKGLSICRWTHPAHESFVPAMDAHFLAYHFGPRAHVGLLLDGEKPESTWCEPGACSYLPARLPVNWNLLTGMNVINILIPDALVSKARNFASGEGTTGLGQPPRVGFRSRTLEQLAIRTTLGLRRGDDTSDLHIQDLVQKLCLKLLVSNGNCHSLSKGPARLTPAQTRRSIEFMHSRLQGKCDLESLSVVAGISSFHFAHAFRNTVGTSPHEYLCRLRTSAAALLLSQSSQAIVQVGLSIGFQSAPSFCNFFNRWMGVSPTTYREAFAVKRPLSFLL